MPNIDLSILNQRQTPAFYADTLANRPAAGFVGRIFVSTNTFAFYRDNGTGWDLIGGPGTGTITGSGATGQIALWDGASTITGDSGLTYDGTDNSLTASKFIVTGGTSSQFLKADGSVDSSSYVPYTGATASLDMGANNLLGQNFFVRGDNSTSGGFLGFRQFSGSSSGTNGYTSISALTQNSLYFQFSQTDGSNKTFELSTALLGTTVRQYQFPDADGTFALTSNLTAYVPYTGATANVDLGAFDLTADLITGATGSFTSSGGSNTFGITHSSGSGIALNILKDGDGEGLFITKGSGSGNAATINGGLVRIENNSGDAQLQIVSSSAPSVRIDNAATGATKRAGLGISTAVNNFIQGSADRDFCIFNSSTTASPILFGVYDAGLTNTQEAARISPARNFLVGTSVDSGQKLIVNGTSLITGAASFSNNLTLDSSTNPTIRLNGAAGGAPTIRFDQNGVNKGWLYLTSGGILQINNTAADGQGIAVNGNNVGIGTTSPAYTLSVVGTSSANSIMTNPIATFAYTNAVNIGDDGTDALIGGGNSGTNLCLLGRTGGVYTKALVVAPTSNILIGTTTDAGQKLQVAGAINSSGASSGYLYEDRTTSVQWELYASAGTARFFNNAAGIVANIAQATGVYTATSDKNKKKNFEASNLGLDAVLKLKPTLYNMISQSDHEVKELGFIAQEVKEVIKQAYVQNGEFIGLNYQPIVATLVKAIQELNTKIENLK